MNPPYLFLERISCRAWVFLVGFRSENNRIWGWDKSPVQSNLKLRAPAQPCDLSGRCKLPSAENQKAGLMSCCVPPSFVVPSRRGRGTQAVGTEKGRFHRHNSIVTGWVSGGPCEVAWGAGWVLVYIPCNFWGTGRFAA